MISAMCGGTRVHSDNFFDGIIPTGPLSGVVQFLPVDLGGKHALQEPARLSKDSATLRYSLHLTFLIHVRYVPEPALYHRVF